MIKKSLSAILCVILMTAIIHAQDAKESSGKTAPTTSATSKKLPDLNNLISLTGQKAPGFRVADLNGTEFDLDSLRGKIIVINLWATWCKPCIAEFPELNDLTAKFGKKDVVFLAATREDKALVEGFLKKHIFSYQVFPNALDLVKQYSPKEKPDAESGKSRTIQALPTHIVIDRKGTVVKHFWGYNSQRVPELMRAIEQLLNTEK